MDIGRVLKDEIRRLARAELRKQTGTLRKATAQLRRDNAALKRELGDTRKRVRALEKQLSKLEGGPGTNTSTEGRRFSAKRLRTHREKLGLSRKDYAALADVSASSIYQWENGSHRPGEDAFARLIEVRALGKRAAQSRLAAIDAG